MNTPASPDVRPQDLAADAIALVHRWLAEAEGGIFDLYELLPGFLFAVITAVVVSLITYTRNEDIEAEFDAAVALVRDETAPERAGV
ncbi:hypothetical protein [Citricoccus sp. NR2]|uniref:hypothetical protein n=1 Tax=Citricoccus sp. NR2 TaxID=3004095 RepID=UPI0022DDE126|nr:hypothetical protein [Citricoccus sp. NR2]WBL19848.1 hypothetical protein O1A05_03900 [Citricoccus sp. NR2]